MSQLTSSLHEPLLSAASTASTSPSSSPATSHAVDVGRACRLLAVPPPIRAMMLDYTDDHTAIVYLSTCQSLYAGYHSYPLKQAIAEQAFVEAAHLQHYFTRWRPFWLYIGGQLVLLGAAALIIFTPWPFWLLLVAVIAASFIVGCCWLGYLLLTRRSDCCARRGWGMWGRHHPMPRVTRLSEPLCDPRLLRYLQHVTELTVVHRKNRPIGRKYPLPHSLRTLRLNSSPDLVLDADTLPPSLTSLSLSEVNSVPLPAGVLPQSLTSLQLRYGFDTRWPIGAGVLPSSLRLLELNEWTLPLSQLALPPSLIELDIRWLSNHPLPVLPAQLQVLRIGGAFNQSLVDVLPPSLRELQLTGHFDQPLTADLFACTPQLEELHLSDHATVHDLHVDVLPGSLRVLRLGKQRSPVFPQVPHALCRLCRVLVSAEWDAERVRSVVQAGQVAGFTVEQEPAQARR